MRTHDFGKACRSGYIEEVRRLLEEGADMNEIDVAGWTPLMNACAAGHVQVVRLLIDCGANINYRSGQDKGMTALMLAALLGETEVVRLLLDNGTDIDAKNHDGETAQDIARTYEFFDIVDLLLKRKTAQC
ncbi:MAG: ankyrin repeat domain-containing protein [Desulfomonilaceae bacterium]